MGSLQSKTPFSTTPRCQFARQFLGWAIVLAASLGSWAAAKGAVPRVTVRVEGTVRDSGGKLIADASVFFQGEGEKERFTARTGANGAFAIATLPAGAYSVWAEKTGAGKSAVAAITLSPGEPRQIDLILLASGPGNSLPSQASRPAKALGRNLELEGQPEFTVAGLTDWTNAGGHGSDVHLRTSETLTKETLTLQPRNAPQAASARLSAGIVSAREKQLRENLKRAPGSFAANRQLGEFCLHSQKFEDAIPYLERAYEINRADYSNAYDLALAYDSAGQYEKARHQAQETLKQQNRADLHRLLGEINERMNDPLGAVSEYEQAVRLDPSEPNYFSWGTELLYHRAIEPAIQVFSQASRSHPHSARLLMGLAVALYARGSNAEAARQLAEASQLDPAAPDPYLFMGQMENGVRTPIPGGEETLGRFLHLHPDNALANYYYAVSLWKRSRLSRSGSGAARVEALLQRAVELDPKLALAYLQMGILYSDEQKFPNAIQAYRRAIQLRPGLEEAYYRLAQAYLRAGDEAKAQEEFRVYERVDRQKTAEIQKGRREIRQFVIVWRGQPPSFKP